MSAYPTTTDPTAVVGRRFGAFVVDVVVLWAIPVALFFATAGITLYERPATCPQVEAAGEISSSEECSDDLDITINDDKYTAATYKPAAFAIAGGVSLLYLIVVQWVVQGLTGATLGKAIFGIRTVNEAGESPGLGKQFIRGVLWIVDGLCNGLVAAILILVSKGHRRLGDMAAKTYVVRSAAKDSPIVVPGDQGQVAPPYGGSPASPPPAPGAAAAPVAGAAGYTPTEPPPSPTDPTTTYAAPSAPEAPAEAAAPQQPDEPAAAPAASGPVWDASRNAYIQWDPSGGRWLTYDDGAAQWKPIEGDQPPPPS